jgi:PAS domain S-box-containing protein
MNFWGRVIATVPSLIISIWLLQHTYHEGGHAVFYMSFIVASFALTAGWIMGGYYDKAKKKDDLQQIFDSLDETVWSNDVVNQRIYVSKGIEKLIGYSDQRFYDDYSFWIGLIHAEDRQKGLEFNDRVMNGYSDEAELRFVDAQGDDIWVYLSGTPIFKDGSNEVIKINGVVVDITERKKAEMMLEESESRYRSVVEFTPNIVLIHQEDTIVYVNPATLQVLGLNEASEVVGKDSRKYKQ